MMRESKKERNKKRERKERKEKEEKKIVRYKHFPHLFPFFLITNSTPSFQTILAFYIFPLFLNNALRVLCKFDIFISKPFYKFQKKKNYIFF